MKHLKSINEIVFSNLLRLHAMNISILKTLDFLMRFTNVHTSYFTSDSVINYKTLSIFDTFSGNKKCSEL